MARKILQPRSQRDKEQQEILLRKMVESYSLPIYVALKNYCEEVWQTCSHIFNSFTPSRQVNVFVCDGLMTAKMDVSKVGLLEASRSVVLKTGVLPAQQVGLFYQDLAFVEFVYSRSYARNPFFNYLKKGVAGTPWLPQQMDAAWRWWFYRARKDQKEPGSLTGLMQGYKKVLPSEVIVIQNRILQETKMCWQGLEQPFPREGESLG